MSDSHESMDFWSEIVGQPAAVDALERAASPGANSPTPGSSPALPARAARISPCGFAAALTAREPGDRERVFAQVRARTHPDVAVLTTQKVVIGIDDVRDIVTTAHYAPAEGRHRVIVIEDADRMPERTSNVLLKALEEPPDRTVWVLCAPSEADLLPTTRSRARSLRLVTPGAAEVARLLHERDGVPLDDAERAARLSQSHIGMARRLAGDPEALRRRERSVELALGVETLGDAMRAAAELLKVAQADADAFTEQLDAAEREDALRGLGLAPGAAIPPQLRAQIRALEEDQKRRATRSLRDGIDRILTDLLSLYRDMLLAVLQSGLEQQPRIEEIGRRWGAVRVLAAVEAVEEARARLNRAVTPGLVLEALFSGLVVQAEGAPA
ncbi:MAG: DNA polymerase III subunit delta' [Actinobacteria bacterium]|nr:DNA polymerase III subunit delta' [Actinomycetota bacterium]